MGLNISTTMGFENREHLNRNAKNILENSGAPKETSEKIVETLNLVNTNKADDFYLNPQLSVLKASSQLSLNINLKETLKYLKSHASKKQTKEPQFGEIWEIFSENIDDEIYNGELCDFEVDIAKNIFVAA